MTAASSDKSPTRKPTGDNIEKAREGAGDEDQDTIRNRVIQLVFGGDSSRFDEFINVLAESTPAGVEVILRGSSITGYKWKTGEPFDADGPGTSDMDVTFVGGDMVSLFREFHIPGVHSVPFGEDHPFASPPLAPLRKRLCEMVGRPVNLQASATLVQFLREVTMDQPYLTLLKTPDEDTKETSAD